MKIDLAFPRVRSPRRYLFYWAIAIIGLVLASLIITLQTSPKTAPSVPKPARQKQVRLPPALAYPNLVKQLTFEQAIDQNDKLPFAQRPVLPASEFLLSTTAANRERAIKCLAEAVYYEAGTESVAGQRAVAQIVLNRMRHPAYPSSVCGVVFQGSARITGCQFTFTCDGSMLRAPQPARFALARQIAIEALGGRVAESVGHATNYHADYVLPYWAASLDKTAKIGRHIFYRLKGSLGERSAFRQPYGGNEPSLIVPTLALDPNLLTDQSVEGGPALPSDVQVPAAGPTIIADLQIRETPIADASDGALLVDRGVPITARARAVAQNDCPAKTASQTVAVKPNDLRAGVKSDVC